MSRRKKGKKTLSRPDGPFQGGLVCPLCLASGVRPLRAGGGVFFRCRRCGIVFNSAYRPLSYDESYFLDDYRGQYGKTYAEDREAIRRLADARLVRIFSLYGGGAPRGSLSLLDVGSALGFFAPGESPWSRITAPAYAKEICGDTANTGARDKVAYLDYTVTCTKPEMIRGKNVLVIEDGPTLTHGEMKIGAGWVAAKRLGAAEIVDPRPYAIGALAETYAKYPNTGTVLPAMGYGAQQVADLEATIRNTPHDVVLIATPIDLRRLVTFDKPALRVGYELQEIGEPTLEQILHDFVK